MLRRTAPRTTATVTATATVLAGSLWHEAAGAVLRRSGGPYGPLREPDANGIALPEGFSSRIVARTGRRIGGVLWHPAPDGGACFPDGDGWIYVSNSEAPLLGGASAIRFGPDGAVAGAYRILSGTDLNRAGGRTPWNSWLSCEEILRGRVFECDPYGSRAAMPRLAMGRFRHEAASCDPDRGVVYLTEDEPDGCFYRFRPAYWGDLTSGVLEVLCAASGRGRVTWRRVPDPGGSREATRDQVGDARRFSGGEGCHYADGLCFFTTRGDNRVWAYDAEREHLEVAYDADAPATGAVTTPPSDLYVAGGGGDMEINLITPGRVVTPVLRISGHPRSEITGPAFSPGGDRLYFSSRRGPRGDASGTDGVTYEVTGPFRR
ncbi:alkaline phosphatase PhoX [Streptosporangium sp. NBC_01469]|uniref:alkaline phosphatase PhoX n=1 Tax=Streptosporangium sp. NBC_01469 TaxID=2903898 RepID=UPI002E2CD4E4|nr:alkaline phosphatase PhoX [Streptosporangium sp. NBC_01469]